MNGAGIAVPDYLYEQSLQGYLVLRRTAWDYQTDHPKLRPLVGL